MEEDFEFEAGKQPALNGDEQEEDDGTLEKTLWAQAEDDLSITKQVVAAAFKLKPKKSKWAEEEEEENEEDIVADINLKAKLPYSSSKKSSYTFSSSYDSKFDQTPADDCRDLTQMLLNEMGSPDLQPYRLFESLKEKSKEQMEKAFASDGDALEKAIYEMDSNRIDFELVSLNRIRLQKIAKFATYFLRNQLDRMSAEEIDFAQSYVKLRSEYMSETFLSKLPATFQDMEYQDELESYPKPNLRSFVLSKATRDLGQLFPGEMIEKNAVFACPYSLIQEQVNLGTVQLI